MLNIIRQAANATKEDIYFMSAAPNIGKMSDLKGSKVEVTSWVIYEDQKDDGSDTTITAILDADGEAHATNSRVFRKDFENIIDIFGDDFGSLEVVGGISKAGRDYVTCVYARA